ncbi:PncB [Desulforapulum autotrophicum HRM2]|uniref:Nicotinate phosphoribosyltransferase n=1 Tax=Desulforapulum autotrophicum (strain ATCC 43914 / DSM 3382 / VKM B-1955 / HRM2) TaxID=177437 RepID=PNCB_DESAH|nr:nicotinate phosphoribosyltransferase [Desulforapulum autotrophicum]C0QFM5.1 RecName: Full=Nicotinate phosphoribosyltransferase; Short=NAPRTase [Desulforapulum autotrophicum HRM2]ACN13421.1 PncB [Desulforapulum autotrophicum HRM2]
MIQSILDNDLYKFTMQQAVHMLYPRVDVEYEFINRSNTPFPKDFAQRLQVEVQGMKNFRLTPEEKEYLDKTCYFMTPVYLDFLEHYTFDPDEVTVSQTNSELSVTIKGPWYRTILWEVPLMAIISELYFVMTNARPLPDEQIRVINLNKAKILSCNNIRYADFGTRRRFSSSGHEALIRDILALEHNTLIGTSNVNLARLFNIKPIGTMAHEWIMFHGVLNGYRMANPTAVAAWATAFHGHLGIALTDTFTTDIFLSTFDTLHAKLFDGVRHDSGDPIAFIDRIVDHYKKLHIDPITKTIVFSDGLDIDKAVHIHNHCINRIRDSYGIGTNLTNDVGVTPLNMVIKLAKCRTAPEKDWHNAIKLSDDKGKHTGDSEELAHCIKVLERGM